MLVMEAGVKELPLEGETSQEEAIIVDKRDPGFRLISPPRRKLMEWFRPEKREDDSKNKWGIHLAREWSYLIDEQFHGEGTRDAWYKCSGQGVFKAEWQAVIREAGEYEVFVYNVKLRKGADITNTLSTTRREYTTHYTIQTANGEEEIIFYPGKEAGGWVSLGKFIFRPGKTVVVLSDKGMEANWGESSTKTDFRSFFNWNQRMRIVRMENQIIVADAVKWVKRK